MKFLFEIVNLNDIVSKSDPAQLTLQKISTQ